MEQFYEGKELDLLLRKGVCPYDYVNHIDKLEETKLSPKKEFYPKLDGTNTMMIKNMQGNCGKHSILNNVNIMICILRVLLLGTASF